MDEDARVVAAPCHDPIQAKRITKEYPKNCVAVNSISFAVEKKQIFGLLGPTGAGKSTLFNILTANVNREAGSVCLLGHDIDGSN